MPKPDRREAIIAGAAIAGPLTSMIGISHLASPNARIAFDDKEKGKKMKLQYLEIVTAEAEALCKQYEETHGVSFGKPEPGLGNARIAELEGGSKIAIRGPLREGEAPVIRPYMHVEDLGKAVDAAKKAGAEVAIAEMPIPGHGTIAIVIQGGIESGFWKS